MIVLITVLMKDLGVRYNPERIHNVDFTHADDLFLSGLLRGTGGTCISMPVLYVAIGRRLGCPLKLVEGPEHLFLRWEDQETGERFNIEGTTQGFVSEPDEYYKEWPRNLSDLEHEQGYFLKSLSPKEELAVFLTTRGHALHDMGNLLEAQKTYEKALALSPKNIPARTWLTKTIKRAKTGGGTESPLRVFPR
jgi:regulator of sirC expression with transglutaminase-like and TPR domain